MAWHAEGDTGYDQGPLLAEAIGEGDVARFAQGWRELGEQEEARAWHGELEAELLLHDVEDTLESWDPDELEAG